MSSRPHRRLSRPPWACGSGRTRRNLEATEIERTRLSERARLATQLDVELRVACRSEAAIRLELGSAACALLRKRAYRRLGFVRLSDYARERLGISARTLESAAWLAKRLDALPAVATAFDRSELSWTQARAICAVASPDDEDRWLTLARECTVEHLERLARRSRTLPDIPADPEVERNEIDGEPAVRLRLACPARVRALWRRALELASRVAGEPLADWRAAEIIAAEGLSGRPGSVSLAERTVLASMRLARRLRRGSRAGSVADDDETPGPSDPSKETSACETLTSETSASKTSTCETSASKTSASATIPSDPFALDARLVAAMKAIRTTEPRVGHLLRVVVAHRLYRPLGFTSFDAYVRERLGISIRKAWALLKVERATRRGDAFAQAYDDGRLSWVRALTLLPVVHRYNAAAWTARAGCVTVRRLCDEVNWVLEARDACGGDATLEPPPLDSRLTFSVDGGFRDERCRKMSLATSVHP